MGLTCSGCGKKIEKTDVYWHLRIELWANVESNFEPMLKSEVEVDRELELILQRIDITDAELLENEVYQAMQFILCRDCRDRFAANPLNKPFLKQ
ncbi:hypothetical protein JXA40_00555 [bacterium]|nr:hypothetical protein [candidate division CSSED10-310 bacterium]